MKRTLSVLLIIALAICFCSCSKTNKEGASGNSEASSGFVTPMVTEGEQSNGETSADGNSIAAGENSGETTENGNGAKAGKSADSDSESSAADSDAEVSTTEAFTTPLMPIP